MFNLTSRWQGQLRGEGGGGYRAKDTEETTIQPEVSHSLQPRCIGASSALFTQMDPNCTLLT